MDTILKILDTGFFTVVPFVLVLGFMIFVHELGHFLAGRIIGVRILTFKLGFGHSIVSHKRGHTEYAIGWIPIGGYVRMFGDPTEVEEEEEVALEDIPEEDKKEALFFRPAHQKIFTFVAGPAMNVIVAFLLAPLVYLIGYNRQVEPAPPIPAGVIEKDSPADKAGVKMLDKILTVDGRKIESYHDLQMIEALNPEKTLDYEVSRDGEKMSFQIKLRTRKEPPVGESGIGPPPTPAIVGGIAPDWPAAASGLTVGDRIVAINGNKVTVWEEMTQLINDSEGNTIDFGVIRGDKEISLALKPRYNEDHDKYQIGIAAKVETEFVRESLGAAIVKGAEDCVRYVKMTYQVFYKLITFQLSGRAVSGPLGIAAITSSAARSGIVALIQLTVLISINLGILNLLPFPPLDGGHILVTGVESVIRREMNVKYKEAMFKAGFFLLIFLMIAVTASDFWRYKGKMYTFFMDLF